ncbi:DUF2306 domain-containing protein [Flavobacterium sp. MAH-1]|uniref:DUF2306 domain-containing protein n=2 Tax=Flavobacterium agri TaxID=2743471 RepID=A0A7Y8XYK3_9FLAO|nr:DUF2306 domain-containing protein [Flavobacterium agri]NYA69314.1 DUF2306 domain-containing protein [Flavobacterium agri]
MIRITVQYIPFDADIAFLRIKQYEVTSFPEYLPIFYIHVYSSIFVLLAGFTQFSSRILHKFPQVHRYNGRLYAYVVLLLSAPSGIYIGFHANGGLMAKISFVLLGALWFWFTWKGVESIRKREIIDHKKWMWRSFALAFSAITLRLWKVLIVFFFEPNPMDVYKIVAWLGWIPNLLLAEYLLTKKLRK